MYKKLWFHFVLFMLGLALDQGTKIWAERRFTDAYGEPNFQSISVIGDLWHFNLAYNLGSAFSMRPAQLLPFLTPTIFYTIITLIASGALIYYYRKTEAFDWVTRLGCALILSGAWGNLSDRYRIGKVVDFIDWDFPDIFGMTRWPTFNLADSWVLIGVALIGLSPYILKSLHKPHSVNEAEPKDQE